MEYGKMISDSANVPIQKRETNAPRYLLPIRLQVFLCNLSLLYNAIVAYSSIWKIKWSGKKVRVWVPLENGWTPLFLMFWINSICMFRRIGFGLLRCGWIIDFCCLWVIYAVYRWGGYFNHLKNHHRSIRRLIFVMNCLFIILMHLIRCCFLNFVYTSFARLKSVLGGQMFKSQMFRLFLNTYFRKD